MSVYRLFLTLALGSGVLAAFGTNISQAHYLWLRSDISDKEPRLVLYLSEAADLPGDVLPEPIALTPVSWQSFDGPPVAVDMRPLKEDALEVHSPAIEQDSGGVATAVCKFGIFRGRRLTYFAKHVACTDWNQLESPLASKEFLIDLAPHVRGGRLTILATFQGKPLPQTEIRYMAASGKETTPRTDEQGRLEIELPNDGPVSFMLRHKQEEPTGRIGEQEYQGASDYVTLTLSPPSSAAKPADDSASALPKLPEPVASFGAAVAGDWLYVYGGHVGKTHQHSADNLSQHFRRLHLRKPKQWEELPMQTPLQG
ncbi:MAG: kelch repeat-containing protein, partial [Pirellulales bacterium]